MGASDPGASLRLAAIHPVRNLGWTWASGPSVCPETQRGRFTSPSPTPLHPQEERAPLYRRPWDSKECSAAISVRFPSPDGPSAQGNSWLGVDFGCLWWVLLPFFSVCSGRVPKSGRKRTGLFAVPAEKLPPLQADNHQMEKARSPICTSPWPPTPDGFRNEQERD